MYQVVVKGVFKMTPALTVLLDGMTTLVTTANGMRRAATVRTLDQDGPILARRQTRRAALVVEDRLQIQTWNPISRQSRILVHAGTLSLFGMTLSVMAAHGTVRVTTASITAMTLRIQTPALLLRMFAVHVEEEGLLPGLMSRVKMHLDAVTVQVVGLMQIMMTVPGTHWATTASSSAIATPILAKQPMRPAVRVKVQCLHPLTTLQPPILTMQQPVKVVATDAPMARGLFKLGFFCPFLTFCGIFGSLFGGSRCDAKKNYIGAI
jgi:hypothetical protein